MFLQSIRRGFVPRSAAAKVREIRIRVRAGYEPDRVVVRAGQPLRLSFRREDQLGCTEQVVFPAFGKSATLPPREDVVVELLPEEPGEYEFTCGMGMLRGTLVIEPRHMRGKPSSGASPAASRDQARSASTASLVQRRRR